MSGILAHRGLLLRSSYTGPLDGYTTNLWSAISLRRLLTSWVGQCFTCRRTSDSVTQDIGFDSTGAVDAAALLSFLGASNGTARDLANQQGVSGRGFFNATAANQPTAATAGVFNGVFAFDGTNDGLSTADNSGAPSAFTVFFRGKLRSTSGAQLLIEHSSNYNSNNAAAVYYDSGALSVGVHDTAPGGYSRSDFTGDFPNDNVQCWRFDRGQVTSAAMTKLFISGVAETRDANGDAGTLPDSTFGAATWNLAARSGGTLPAALDLHTLLIYQAALNDTDVASISTILAALP